MVVHSQRASQNAYVYAISDLSSAKITEHLMRVRLCLWPIYEYKDYGSLPYTEHSHSVLTLCCVQQKGPFGRWATLLILWSTDFFF